MATADIIQLPHPSEDPMTTSVADEFMTTFNTTTEQSLLDGFDATTITGLAIGCIFMLVMIFLPCYWVCKKSRRGWRKQSTTSGPSDRVYSNSDYTSEDKRRKSDLYSENESGYKSESDFRCVSDYKSESEFQSEAPETVEDVNKKNATLNIENEKNKPKKSENQEDKGKDEDRKNQDNEIKDTDKLMENDKRGDEFDGTEEDKDDGIENDIEDGSEGESTWL